MSTNYYLLKAPNLIERLSGVEPEPRHIGTSSIGWCFLLRIYPEDGITTIRDWYKLWTRPRNIIVDEHSYKIITDRFIEIVTKRDDPPYVLSPRPDHHCTTTGYGYERHPCGLARMKVGYEGCVGHGGTYDYVEGDFG